MSVHHCLFFIRNNKVTAVLCKNHEMSIMKFDGYNERTLDAAYWNDWCEYRGVCREDETDLCFVFDAKPEISQRLKEQSVKCGTIWNKETIESALNILSVGESAAVYTEQGALVCRIGSRRPTAREHEIKLTADYPNAGEDETVNVKRHGKMTPFIYRHCKLLEEYDKEIGRG